MTNAILKQTHKKNKKYLFQKSTNSIKMYTLITRPNNKIARVLLKYRPYQGQFFPLVEYIISTQREEGNKCVRFKIICFFDPKWLDYGRLLVPALMYNHAEIIEPPIQKKQV